MAFLSTRPRGKLTYEHYVLFPEDGNQHEIINGRHYMNAAPNPRHQTVSRLIQFQLMEQIEIPNLGQVFDAPIDLQFDDFNVVQPDIVVVMKSNRIVTPTKIKGVPELVVEILSTSTRERDQQLKRELYEQNRVPEFWIVDADNQLLFCYRLSSEGTYAQPTQHSDEVSIALENVTARIDLSKVW
jgi:Uma2 family endonuclease